MSELAIILMPAETNPAKTSVRYKGLEQRLGQNGLNVAFAHGLDSYQPKSHSFSGLTNKEGQVLEVSDENAAVVRDLTMPASIDRPLFNDPERPKLVHDPEFNEFLKDKRNIVNLLPEYNPQTLSAPAKEVLEAAAAICGAMVVVKPITGQQSAGVVISKKEDVQIPQDTGDYLVQEYIDTSGGIAELAIQGVHNLRLISIDSQIIGAVGRLDDGPMITANDIYGRVYLPEELPDSMVFIAEKLQQQFKQLPGKGQNVIAIDLMRGKNGQGEEVDVICEVNRRPLRISEYDLLSSPPQDAEGLRWLARQWDTHEANMLTNVAGVKT